MTVLDAIREGNEGRVCSLTRADPTLLEKAETAGGDVPLVVAVEHEKVDMVKLLLKEGANIDGKGLRGETALIRAIKKGNEELVASLLAHGAKADLADAVGNTPLMVASMKGKLDVVKLVFEAMLRAGLESGLNRKGVEEKAALHHAAEGGHFDVVAYLLCKQARVDIQDRDGKTPLMLACEYAPLEVAEMLLLFGGKAGEAVKARDTSSRTALYHAVSSGDEDVVSFLLNKGAQASIRDGAGTTPFMLACEEGHLEAAQMLFDATEGQGLEATDNQGETALHHAATWGHRDVVAFLISKGAQANSRDEQGNTPFMLACQEGHLQVLQMLFDATQGQGLEDEDDDGCTGLHTAISEGHKDVVTFLLSKGAETSSRNVNGSTPLLCACGGGDLELVQMVLTSREGQGLHDRDRNGRTVLHNAASKGTKELVDFLLSKGVQADIKNNQQETALMTACYYGNRNVVRLLLKHTGGQGVNETNSEGRTVLHLAMTYQWRTTGELVRVLLLAGADPDIPDNEGRTPRELAKQARGYTGCVEAFEVSWSSKRGHLYKVYESCINLIEVAII
jgi:ankyrin repeat protein